MSEYEIQREDDFDFRSAEYAALYQASDATAFQHATWLCELYEVLAPRLAAQKVVITARSGSGRLVAVLPLVLRRQGICRVLEFADLGVNDYAAPILDPTFAAALLMSDRIPRQIRAAMGRFDLLRVERVADSPDLMLSLFHRSTAKRHPYSAHVIEVGRTHEEWRATLDPQFSRHLDRKIKRLRPKGERRLRLIDDPLEVDAVMRQMQHFREVRFSERRGTDLVQQPDYFQFYTSVARAALDGGPCRLTVMEIDGETAAVALDLHEHDRELFLLVGYDMERLRNYSLGLVIVDELVRCAIERGTPYFDLTVGDENYKADFGARPRPLFEVLLPRTVQGRLSVVGREGYLVARRVVKRLVLGLEERQKRRKQVR